MVVSTGAVRATTVSEWGGCSTISIARLVELPQKRVLLELGELVRLGDLGEIGRADAPDLLGLLEQLPDFLDQEDVVDVDLGHARRGTQTNAVGDNLSRPARRV